MSDTMKTHAVYKAISDVTAELAKEGISKDRKNAQQGYNFRGIDDVYNVLAPALAKNGLVMIPRFLSRTCEERTTQKGGALFYVTVEAEFDFVAVEDGSMHTARTFGEAMDSADKATNKAMSAAYKYAAFQTFAIPTEGDNDADSTSHDVKSKKAEEKKEPLTEERINAIGIEVDRCPTVAALGLLFNKLTKEEQGATKDFFSAKKKELTPA